MSRMHRAGMALAIGALAVGAAATAQAQIQGMPLFTNPRFATGVRVHADLGLPTDKSNVGLGDYNVVQGGVTLALWRLGIDANVGATRDDFKTITSGTNSYNVGTQTKVTASALAQIMLAGGGPSPLAFSVFAGASMDVKAYQFSSLPDSIKNQLGGSSKVLTVPAGVALGVKLPLVIINPNLWGAARMDFTKIINCPSGASCPTSKGEFRWAVGLDVPILRIISVRAAYDSGKIYGVTVNNFGVGASIGLGGVR
jgi:hypothetical protein